MIIKGRTAIIIVRIRSSSGSLKIRYQIPSINRCHIKFVTIDMGSVLSNIKRIPMPIMAHKRVLSQWVFGKSKRKFLRMCQTIKINTKGSKIITI